MNVLFSLANTVFRSNKSKFQTLSACVIGATLLFATTGYTQDQDMNVVVKGRRSNLRDLGAAFKGVTDELKSGSPNVGVIRGYAHQIKELSDQQRFWFPVGSGPSDDLDEETKAKAEIWTKPTEFAQVQSNFAKAAAKFAATAKAGELDAIRSEYKALGKTCQACHKTFREKED